jgi:hypothetical protein
MFHSILVLRQITNMINQKINNIFLQFITKHNA